MRTSCSDKSRRKNFATADRNIHQTPSMAPRQLLDQEDIDCTAGGDDDNMSTISTGFSEVEDETKAEPACAPKKRPFTPDVNDKPATKLSKTVDAREIEDMDDPCAIILLEKEGGPRLLEPLSGALGSVRKIVLSETHLFLLKDDGLYAVLLSALPRPQPASSWFSKLTNRLTAQADAVLAESAVPSSLSDLVERVVFPAGAGDITNVEAFSQNVFACCQRGKAYKIIVTEVDENGTGLNVEQFAPHGVGPYIRHVKPGGTFCVVQAKDNSFHVFGEESFCFPSSFFVFASHLSFLLSQTFPRMRSLRS